VRVRGLKRAQTLAEQIEKASHPVRVRGLKHGITAEMDKQISRRTPCGCVD